MTAIVTEVAAILALTATGALLVPRSAGNTWRLAVALPLGVAVLTVATLLLLLTGLPIARPWVTMTVSLLGAAVVAVRRSRHATASVSVADEPSRKELGLAAALVMGLAVALTATVPIVTVTSDSFRYLTVAWLLVGDGDASGMSAFLLQTRSLATGALHGLALAEPGYLRAVTPLLAASGALALWVLTRVGTNRLAPTNSRLIAGGAVALVISNHRFLFNALYVNGHLLFAVWLLLLVGVSWRRLSGTTPETGFGDAVVAALLAAGIVLVRPEGVLVVVLALVPVAIAGGLPRRWRRTVLVGTGVVTVLWHLGVLSPLTIRDGYATPVEIHGLTLVGAGLVAIGLALPWVDRITGRWTLSAVSGLLWLCVLAFTATDPGVLKTSFGSTARNVVNEGAWGVSLLVLAALFVVAVGRHRVDHEQLWLFPLLSFVPLVLLLAFLRGGAYRVGPGDSLNRMLLHVLPLAVFALAVTADGEPRRWRWSRWSSAGDGDQDRRAELAGADRHG